MPKYIGQEWDPLSEAVVGTTAPVSPHIGALWLDTGASPGAEAPLSVVSKTTTYTAALTDDVILCDASGGAFTVTLPVAATAASGKRYWIKRTSAGSNAVTIDGDGSETIDGATTLVIGVQYDTVCIVCDGTEWWVI